MKTSKLVLASGVIAALTTLSVRAADPPRCNELFEDAQRLACYDVVFGKPVRTGTASASAAASSAPAAPLAAAAAAGGAVAIAAPPPAPKVPAAKPQKFKAPVTALTQTADGRFIATLENGQKWLQLERDSKVEIKVGDSVELHPMMFGSWSLVTRTGYMLRVKELTQ